MNRTPEQLKDGAGEVARTRVYEVSKAEDRLAYHIRVVPQRQDADDRYLSLASYDPETHDPIQPSINETLVRQEVDRQALGAEQMGAQRPEPLDINGIGNV